ncbi:hypothetical protein BDN71DRAFT_1437241 [Pleurotus eryngii]|uniref:Uncharacterized protein n=1 Tax=Pleurotus eryngii TaxID=5323 RepID=A0A9P5ZGB4_PLEER|nr:hypothetical protein BDN71DRAFT_1437241 [Pleurotus eryngii]
MENEAAASGSTVLHAKSATTFLSMGLTLEETQHRLKAQASERDLTSTQAAKVEEARLAFHRQLKQFWALQAVYMPLALALVDIQVDERPEDFDLYFPSSLDAEKRNRTCAQGLATKEDKLREAQCRDSLDRIRLLQRAKRHVVIYKKKSQPGQRTGTRARSEFDRLDGIWMNELRELRDQDIRPPPAFDIDANTTARNMKEAATRLGEGHREVPWIWRSAGVMGDGDDTELNEGLRIEWAKSRARALRWSEEVRLCKEEMRRVRETLKFKAQQWSTCDKAWTAIEEKGDDSLIQGILAFARTQTNVYEGLLDHFTMLWNEAPKKRHSAAIPEDEGIKGGEDRGTINVHIWGAGKYIATILQNLGKCRGPGLMQ